MQLTDNFTLEELTKSVTAEVYGIKNEPNENEVENLRRLAVHVLQPARDILGRPLRVTSGFRCDALNKRVGGKSNSFHRKGMAADIHCESESDGILIAGALLKSSWTDLVIVEHSGRKHWVHVQWSWAPRHRLITDYAG